MKVVVRLRWLAVPLIACCISSCSGGGDSPPSPTPTPLLQFPETVVAPVTVTGASTSLSTTGGVITIRLLDISPTVLNVTKVVPIADPHLRATYIGFSDCTSICVGAAPWNADTSTKVAHSVTGTVPFTLPVTDSRGQTRGPLLQLIFRLEAPSVSDARTLQQRCLRITAVRFTLSDGTVVTLGPPGGSFIGGMALSPPPAGYHDCK